MTDEYDIDKKITKLIIKDITKLQTKQEALSKRLDDQRDTLKLLMMDRKEHEERLSQLEDVEKNVVRELWDKVMKLEKPHKWCNDCEEINYNP